MLDLSSTCISHILSVYPCMRNPGSDPEYITNIDQRNAMNTTKRNANLEYININRINFCNTFDKAKEFRSCFTDKVQY